MEPISTGAFLGATFGTSLLGNMFNVGNVASTNSANRDIARDQMNFQERMSNTAHQREVADLQAAGLNPILSAGGGNGASTPAGATATMQAPQISLPDIFTYGMSMRQAEQRDKELAIAADKIGIEKGRLEMDMAESGLRRRGMDQDYQIRKKDYLKSDVMDDMYELYQAAKRKVLSADKSPGNPIS